jgi:hypothetical protein
LGGIWSVILLVTQILAGLLGALLVYAAAFLYPDERNRLQNRLADLWIQLDDRSKVSTKIVLSAVRRLTRVVVFVLRDRFGFHFQSGHSFVMAGLLAVFPIFLYSFRKLLATQGILEKWSSLSLDRADAVFLGLFLVVLGLVAVAAICLVTRVAHAVVGGKAYWFVGLVVGVLVGVSIMTRNPVGILLACVYATVVAMNFLSLRIADRIAVNVDIRAGKSPTAIIWSLIWYALLLASFVVVPYAMHRLVPHGRLKAHFLLLTLASTTAFFPVVLWLLLAFFLAAERMLWGAILRPLYNLWDAQIFSKNRIALGALGITLLLYALIGLTPTPKEGLGLLVGLLT